METLSPDEITQLVELLEKCTPGHLPPSVFEAIARVSVYSAVEFIPLRKSNDRIEVLLFERPNDDLIWPSMLHTPGTILRPTDRTYQDAFNRLYTEELNHLESDPPLFVGAYLSQNNRGRCLLLEHVLNVTGEPNVGAFYDVENLPSLFIEAQRPSLERAVTAYRNM